MKRIAVIGNAGGGKSTLARRLAAERALPYHEIDAFQWHADWSPIPAEEYQAAHAAVLAGDAWVLDGFGNFESVVLRFERADTVILVDLPLWVHYWLAAERQIAWAKGAAECTPAGHGAPPPTGKLFELMWQIDRDYLPRLRALVDNAEEAGKAVYRLTALDQLTDFTTLY